MQCEFCDQAGAQLIAIEVGRTSYFHPLVKRRAACLPCVKTALVLTRPDEAAELCEFIGRFQFGQEGNEMASYKEIQTLMADLTADVLVNLPKGKKLGPEQLGDATYRMTQLRLLASIAQSLDSIAYSMNQQAAATKSGNGIWSKLEGHYKRMADIAARKQGNGPRPTGGMQDAAPPTGSQS